MIATLIKDEPQKTKREEFQEDIKNSFAYKSNTIDYETRSNGDLCSVNTFSDIVSKQNKQIQD